MKIQFLFSKIYVFISQVNYKKRSYPSFAAYLNDHLTLEECTATEKASNDLAIKVERIPHTGEARQEMLHQL